MINNTILPTTGRGSVNGTVEDGFVNANRIYKVGIDSITSLKHKLNKYDMVELDATDATAVVPYAGGQFAGIVGTLGLTPDTGLDTTVVLYTQGEFYKNSIQNLPSTLPAEVVDNGITVSFNLHKS